MAQQIDIASKEILLLAKLRGKHGEMFIVPACSRARLLSVAVQYCTATGYMYIVVYKYHKHSATDNKAFQAVH